VAKRGLKPRCQPAIVKLLALGPLTVAQIHAQVFCAQRSAYMVIKQMHTQRLVHVFEYRQRPNVRPVAVWALGDGVDAEYPTVRTNAERQRDYRKRMSADDKDFLKARRRQRSRTIKIDPLIAAFFGVKKG
jgi:hypothetical protein